MRKEDTMHQKEQNELCYTGMKPYEKFLKFGGAALSDAELLAILIRTGTKEEDPVTLGQHILSHPGGCGQGLLGLYRLSIQDLMEIKGIGEVKAVKIKCVTELSRRMTQATRAQALRFTEPESVAAYYMEQLRHEPAEQVLLLLLDNRQQLIHEEILSRGTVNTSLLSPREVFVAALKYGAVNILLLHNHPSGDATPSRQDIEITKQLVSLGKMLQLPLLDHIVIGDNCFTSFRRSGLI